MPQCLVQNGDLVTVCYIHEVSLRIHVWCVQNWIWLILRIWIIFILAAFDVLETLQRTKSSPGYFQIKFEEGGHPL